MSRAAGVAAALVVSPLVLACIFPALAANSAAKRAAAAQDSPVAVIYTAAPVYESLAALEGDERFPEGAQLMLLRGGKVESLAPGFAASADASISFDGKQVLFAGKKNAGDPWQIWEVSLDGSAPRPALSAPTDLIRPLWMPGSRLGYARRENGRFVLETDALGGGDALKLSYAPGNYIPAAILRDGRVLFESGFPLGEGSTPEMYLVYADGSGVESVRCDHGAAREHGRQLVSGDIVFTHGRRLARFTSPLADEESITAPAGDYAGDIAEMPDGRWLLSVRKPGQKHYALVAWRPGAATMFPVAENAARDLVEPVLVAPRDTPKRHPSALHDWKTGNLLALDTRLSRSGALAGAPAAVRVETIGAADTAAVLGTAPVEKDGSFFVQAAANRPLRFTLLDAQGHTLREEHGWFWIRRGEQRICVGCHTGPERAPDNRLPEVLLRSTTPADATGASTAPETGGH